MIIKRLNRIRGILFSLLLGNLCVSAANIIYSRLSGSVSIMADGLHCLVDSASYILSLLSLAKSTEIADKEHPYGHRKFEVAGILGLGFLIMIGLQEIIRTLVNQDWAGHALSVGSGGFVIVLCTLAFYGFVIWQENLWGKRLSSPILLADSKHNLSDIFCSLGVLLVFILAQFGWYKADMFVGFTIILFVGYTAFVIFKQGIDVLLDRSRLDVNSVEMAVRSVDGILDCHHVRSRGMDGAVFVDFHILVDSRLTVEDAHKITHKAETLVKEKFNEVIDVVIHTEPLSDGREPYPWEK